MGRVSMVTVLLVVPTVLCAAGLIGWLAGHILWGFGAFALMVLIAYLMADEPVPQNLTNKPVGGREI